MQLTWPKRIALYLNLCTRKHFQKYLEVEALSIHPGQREQEVARQTYSQLLGGSISNQPKQDGRTMTLDRSIISSELIEVQKQPYSVLFPQLIFAIHQLYVMQRMAEVFSSTSTHLWFIYIIILSDPKMLVCTLHIEELINIFHSFIHMHSSGHKDKFEPLINAGDLFLVCLNNILFIQTKG